MNRSEQISRRTTDIKDISIGLYDHDAAIKYYFDNVIKLSVTDGVEVIRVPLKYASAERWNDIRKSGTVRNRTGQIELPLIVYKRNSLAKNDAIPTNKMNAADPQMFKTVQVKYNNKNRYSNFSKLIGQHPIKDIHQVVIPNYITISYDFIVWTNFMQQTNKIIEAINYHEGTYWGNEKFKFITKIDDYTFETEVNSNEDRYVKSTFSLILNGYLVPDVYNKAMVNKITETIKKITY